MKNIFIFGLGVAAGSLLTWKLIDKKYRDIANDEIEEMREYYRGKNTKKEELQHNKEDFKSIDEPEYKNIEIDREEYVDRIKDLGYTQEEADELANDPDVKLEKTEAGYELFIEPELPEPKEVIQPVIIKPEEFGSLGYNTKCYTYYSDFVLVDDEDNIISDPESILGDALEHFGEYEDDSVYVRNDNVECDYEVLKHERTFSEVYGDEN